MIKILIVALLLAGSVVSNDFPPGYEDLESVIAKSGGIEHTKDQTCWSVWSTEYGICNAAKLIFYSSERTKLVNDIIAQIKKQLELLASLSANHIAKAKTAVASLLKKTKRFRALELNSPEQPESDLRSFANSIDSCWNFMRRAKDAALCYVCSKSNSNYFIEGKAVVLEENCSDMVTSCFSFIKGFSNFVEKTFSLKQKLSTGSNWDTSTIGILMKAMNEADIKPLLEKFETSKSPKEKLHASNSLCLRFLKLNKASIFNVIKEILDSWAAKIGLKTDRLLDLKDDKEIKAPLTTVFDPNVVIYIDNNGKDASLMFSDSSIARSEILNVRPMNLSLAFP